jgi:DNA-binding SARP family transcriptional activator
LSAESVIQLRLLDAFAVSIGGLPVRMTRASQRLLALLAVEGPSTRSSAAGHLWPDSTEPHARASLRTAIWATSQSLPGALCLQGDVLSLTPQVTADLHRLRRTAGWLITAVSRAAALDFPGDLDALNDDLKGQELLPGWDEDWLAHEREQVRQLRMHGWEALSTGLLAQRRCAAALTAAYEAVKLEPLRESANTAVIAAHLAEHNTVEALRHYERYRQLLWDDLRIAPSESLRDRLPEASRGEAGAWGERARERHV